MSGDTSLWAAAVAKFNHPSIWLVVPTLSLLLGQSMASRPIPVEYSFLSFLVFLLLIVKARTRRLGRLVLAAGVSFSVGYVRHWQLLHPDF
jgi:hypothetical protein